MWNHMCFCRRPRWVSTRRTASAGHDKCFSDDSKSRIRHKYTETQLWCAFSRDTHELKQLDKKLRSHTNTHRWRVLERQRKEYDRSEEDDEVVSVVPQPPQNTAQQSHGKKVTSSTQRWKLSQKSAAWRKQSRQVEMKWSWEKSRMCSTEKRWCNETKMTAICYIVVKKSNINSTAKRSQEADKAVGKEMVRWQYGNKEAEGLTGEEKGGRFIIYRRAAGSCLIEGQVCVCMCRL